MALRATKMVERQCGENDAADDDAERGGISRCKQAASCGGA